MMAGDYKDFDDYIHIDNPHMLNLIYTQLDKYPDAKKVLDGLMNTEPKLYRNVYDLDINNKERRFDAPIYRIIPVKYLQLIIKMAKVDLREGLPATTKELFFNCRLSPDAVDGCPELTSDLLLPARLTDAEPEPEKVLDRITHLSDPVKKRLCGSFGTLTANYFSDKWYVKGGVKPSSVSDRLFMMLNLRADRSKNVDNGVPFIRDNKSYPSTVRDLYREWCRRRTDSNRGTSNLRWADIFIMCHKLGVSPHFVLGLDEDTPLLTDSGTDDILFDHYTILPLSERPFFGEMLEGLSR